MAANIRRQMAGENARFLPAGHSSPVKYMGQFSIATRTPRPSAYSMMGGQTEAKRRKLASRSVIGSRPMNVFTVPTPSRAAASITRLIWAT